MSGRPQKAYRDFMYKLIADKDGEYCWFCGQEPGGKKGKSLELDHHDNNIDNNDPSNLHILCKTHNVSLRGVPVVQKDKLRASYSIRNERERDKKTGGGNTPIVKDNVDYHSGSVEMQANAYFEPKFRQEILSIIYEVGSMLKKDAINSGAEIVGCSTVVARRYLDKMLSTAGALQERKLDTKHIIIEFKPDRLEEVKLKSLDEIKQLKPKKKAKPKDGDES